MRFTVPVKTRKGFWNKVEKTGMDPGACWEWRGSRTLDGYGQFGSTRALDGTRLGKAVAFRAHRLAYGALVGPIPDGLFLLHACDNRGCVNPVHLKPGTQQDNIADRDSRGRRADTRGEKQGGHKLTEEQVRFILVQPKGQGRALAAQFGVRPATIYAVRGRKRWSHVRAHP